MSLPPQHPMTVVTVPVAAVARMAEIHRQEAFTAAHRIAIVIHPHIELPQPALLSLLSPIGQDLWGYPIGVRVGGLEEDLLQRG